MRRCSLALLALLLLAPLLLVSEPAVASTTQSHSCTDPGGHRWQVKAVWGSVYSAGGTKRVSAEAVRFTTTADVDAVDYTITVIDGAGSTVQTIGRTNRTFSFDKGRKYLSINPKNPPSAPGVTKVVVTVGAATQGSSGCTLSFLQPGSAAGGSSPTAPRGTWPSKPPAAVCGNASVLSGPRRAPSGAVTVPKGDNSSIDFSRPRTTYWFAPGVHTLGSGQYSQITPGRSSTFVGAPGAVLDGQGKNQYALTGLATGVTVRYLTVRGFVAPMNEGTVNHDSAAGWTIEHNTITGNGGAGVFLGSGNRAAYNCLANNSQYGFQVYGQQVTGVVLDHNEIAGNNTGDWESRVDGCGCTGGGKFWDARDVQVTNNYVHDNKSVGLWADTNNNNFLFQGNWISDNDAQAIMWEVSYNAAIRNNVIRHNLRVAGPLRVKHHDNFPDAAIYVSESGGDARLPHGLVGSPVVDISGNLVEDNYNGVTLWENADRFCGSPANTSTGDCTLVNPRVANLSTCTKGTIDHEPYFSDCRWRTQNVRVHHNTFSMNRARFENCPAALCGRNAVLSNWGSYPDWSPYQGDGVSKRITFNQGNLFTDNTYVGGWRFVVLEASHQLDAAQWQSQPYGQDAGSSFRR